MPEWVKGKKPGGGRKRSNAVSHGSAPAPQPSPWVRGTVSPQAAAARLGGAPIGSRHRSPTPSGPSSSSSTSTESTDTGPATYMYSTPESESTEQAHEESSPLRRDEPNYSTSMPQDELGPFSYSMPQPHGSAYGEARDVGGAPGAMTYSSVEQEEERGEAEAQEPGRAAYGVYRQLDPDEDALPNTYAYSTPEHAPGYRSFDPVDDGLPNTYAYSTPEEASYRQLTAEEMDDEASEVDSEDEDTYYNNEDEPHYNNADDEHDEASESEADEDNYNTDELPVAGGAARRSAVPAPDAEAEQAEEQLEELVDQGPQPEVDLDALPPLTLGAATRLSRLGAQYKNESTQDLKDRNDADIFGAILQLANTVKRLIGLVAELETIDPADAVAIAGFKSRLTPAARGTAAAMDHAQMLAWLRNLRDDKAEMARREELPIDAAGNLDMALLDKRRVQYDTTPEQQAASLVTVSGTGLKRAATHATQPGGAVDTKDSVTHFKGNGYEIFVVGPGGDVHMASHKIAKFHHSSLLGGADVSMAGEMKVQGGVVKEMSNKSGHYRPNVNQFHHFLEELSNQGLALDFPVSGFGVADGTTGQQLVDREMDTAAEKDLKVVTKSFKKEFGADAVERKLTAPPPAGAGLRSDGMDGYERADGTEVTAVQLRQILEQLFGRPAKRKIYQQGEQPIFE